MKKDLNLTEGAIGAAFGLCAPIAIAFLAVIVATIMGVDTENSVFVTIINIITELCFVLGVYYICKRNETSFTNATKINAKPSAKIIGLAFLLGVVCLFLFNPIISLWESLLGAIGYQISAELPFGLNSPGMVIFAIFAVALLPAICEEFLFRGVVLNGLRGIGAKQCIIYSALIFGLMHQSLQQLPYTIILGLISGVLLYYTRSLLPSMLFHFTNNAIVILFMAFPRLSEILFSWWIALESILALQIIVAILCVLLACLIIYFMIKSLKKQFDPANEETCSVSIFRTKQLVIPLCVGILFLIISTIPKFGVI